MKSTPARGMRDLLPRDVELRDHVMTLMENVYKKYGFEKIETPSLEDIEVLSGGGGGENEKLIYRVLKRGKKLELDHIVELDDLTDLGLRFDLTVPLSRFYANNFKYLPTPFKSLQIGSVWRAERPQKGRYRQFTQCDIDIIGENSILAELELISATSEVLVELGFKKFNVRINDRKVLTALAKEAGITAEDHDRTFITLDKIDKIQESGVKDELLQNGIHRESVEKLLKLIAMLKAGRQGLYELSHLNSEVYDSLNMLIELLEQNANGQYHITFDPTLVRGMSYYTGTIFEIEADGLSSSIAGGGRYDNMVSRYMDKNIPACGFSIGFERIITILEDRQANFEELQGKIALLYEKDITTGSYKTLITLASELRKTNPTALIPRSKNMKHQLNSLYESRYTHYCVFDEHGDSILKKIETSE